MEQNRKMLLHALAESFGFVERPSPEYARAYERAYAAVNALVGDQVTGDDAHHTVRVVVLNCGLLGAVESQACAACLASVMGVDLRPVLKNDAAA